MARKSHSIRTKPPELNQPAQESALAFADHPDEDSEGVPVEEPIAVQQHRILTTYTTQAPVSQLNRSIEPDDEEYVDDDDEDEQVEEIGPVDSELPPEMKAFLQEQQGGSTDRWTMAVYRLPSFAKDLRTDPAKRQLCGQIDFTEDYQLEVQRNWARANTPNHFVVLVKKNGRYLKGGTLPVFTCEPYPSERPAVQAEASNAGAAAPIYQPVFFDAPEPAPQAMPSPKQQLREFLDMQKMVREAYGIPAAGAAAAEAPQAPDPETVFLQVLAKDTDIVPKLAKGTLGKLLGDQPAGDRDPWAEVAMEAIKSGQAAQLVSSAIGAIFSGFSGMVSAARPTAAPGAPGAPETPHPAAALPQQEPAAAADPAAQIEEPPPEVYVLNLALDHCARRVPPAVAAERILVIADKLNDQAPAQSIDGYLKLFVSLEPAVALDTAKGLATNGDQVAGLPHALEWTAELQQLLRNALEGGDE